MRATAWKLTLLWCATFATACLVLALSRPCRSIALELVREPGSDSQGVAELVYHMRVHPDLGVIERVVSSCECLRILELAHEEVDGPNRHVRVRLSVDLDEVTRNVRPGLLVYFDGGGSRFVEIAWDSRSPP